jgi:hypothetical protein
MEARTNGDHWKDMQSSRGFISLLSRSVSPIIFHVLSAPKLQPQDRNPSNPDMTVPTQPHSYSSPFSAPVPDLVRAFFLQKMASGPYDALTGSKSTGS